MAKFFCPTKLSENISETPEGYLLCVGVPIGRTGSMEYGEGETPLEVGEDGIVHVSRDADELFDKKTIASFEGKSVTIRHPEQFVGPRNWAILSKGTLHNVRRGAERDEDGEEVLLADLLITDDFAIGLVKNGLREVSCGYEAEYEQTGVGKGRQTNIVGNHLALVEEGRAGSSYAINDHKGRITMSKIAEKLKTLLGKTIDQAVAESEKGKDEAVVAKASKAAGSETNTVMDAEMYDELVKMCDALMAKVSSMKPKSEDAEEEEKKDEKAKDADEEKKDDKKAEDADESLELVERIKALEAAVAKLMDMEKAEAGDEEEESEDADKDDEKKSEDADEEESEDESLEGEEGEASQKKTGDAARAEILAPGFKLPTKGDVKAAVLKEAMKTADGKAAILTLTGGKKPTFDHAQTNDALFLGASEILKLKRGNGLEGTKDVGFESSDATKEEMTPEKMNELNAAHWAGKKGN